MLFGSRQILSAEDARRRAKRRLPRLVFDFVDGAAGYEVGMSRNASRLADITLQSRVMPDVAKRDMSTFLLGTRYDVPFGIAPMGMCNLVCPGADRMMAKAARAFNMPVCLSTAASSSIEDMRSWAGDKAWFQLYFGESVEASLASVSRAQQAGYDTLVLTVDVPEVSRRVRDLQNGFTMPFRMTPRALLDFAMHPRWSLSTLAAGVPSPQNVPGAKDGVKFDRAASRAGADWQFLSILREKWGGKLIVKGVTSSIDAQRVRSLGADAIYVSNHGARQLDSSPAAVDLLPPTRAAVGPDFPLLFDSGIRNGEDVVKALAKGADFVMLGRSVMYALGAGGKDGLFDLLTYIAHDISVAMAQIGTKTIPEIGPQVLFSGQAIEQDIPRTKTATNLHIAGKT